MKIYASKGRKVLLSPEGGSGRLALAGARGSKYIKQKGRKKKKTLYGKKKEDRCHPSRRGDLNQQRRKRGERSFIWEKACTGAAHRPDKMGESLKKGMPVFHREPCESPFANALGGCARDGGTPEGGGEERLLRWCERTEHYWKLAKIRADEGEKEARVAERIRAAPGGE